MGAKKTHEQYVEELKVVNPNIEAIGIYVNSNTKISHRCVIHNCVWDAYPTNVLRGHGCKKCGGIYQRTHDEYVEELKIKNPNIEVVGKLIDIKTKITHRCLIHNIIFDKTPSEALTGSGCQQCHIDKTISKRTKSHEQYVDELKISNPNIEVLEKYQGSLKSILHKCVIHNYEWMVSPSSMLKRNGCPKCNKKYRRTHNEYVDELRLINPNVEVLERYVNATTKILHRCLIHDYKWMSTPDSMLSYHGCNMCAADYRAKLSTKTHEQYTIELSENNPNIEVLGKYQKCLTPILHKCKICNYEWMAIPSNLLQGVGCPLCNISNGEFKVKRWLESHNIEYVAQKKFDDCKDKKSLPFDFYLIDYNTCIEFDGEQHFKPVSFGSGNKKRIEEIFEYTQNHDKIKNEYCEANGIKLIRIAFNENIEEKLNLLFA